MSAQELSEFQVASRIREIIFIMTRSLGVRNQLELSSVTTSPSDTITHGIDHPNSKGLDKEEKGYNTTWKM
jgi:hypothetical protein